MLHDKCFIDACFVFLQIIEARIQVDIKNNLWMLLKELCKLAARIDRLSENRQALLYRQLSPKIDRLFAWLCRLIRNQSPQVESEVRENILQIKLSFRLLNLYLQLEARTRN